MNSARGFAEASAWTRAALLAERTPATRNRYVDFLRVASIAIVVVGHWLMAAPSVERGEFTLSDVLRIAPWTQWLTWVFQVMPVFFIVGGYANATSWEAARRSGRGYDAWLSARLQRLVWPVAPVLLFWSALALAGRQLDLPERTIEMGSKIAFVSTWFLAVYVMVVLVVPATHWLWARLGMRSFWTLVLSAIVVDMARLVSAAHPVGWGNYAFVWLALHQLGYAWRDGKLRGLARALPLAAGSFVTLVVLVRFAGYPVSMVTVPGEEFANASPPTLALLALGTFQAGLILAAEPSVSRWLAGTRLWTTTVLVNGMIMTLYLWHATVMVLLVGLASWLGGVALALTPDTLAWWATRPLWILALLLGLCVFVSIFQRFEVSAGSRAWTSPAWRSIAGAVMVCAGLGALAIDGIGAPAAPGVVLTFTGVILAAGVPVSRWRAAGQSTSRTIT